MSKTQASFAGIAAALDKLFAILAGSPAAVVNHAIPPSLDSGPDVVLSGGPGGSVMTAKLGALLATLRKDGYGAIAAKFANGVFVFDAGDDTEFKRARCNEVFVQLALIESAQNRVTPLLSRFIETADYPGTVALAGPNGPYFQGVGLQLAYPVVLRQVNLLIEDQGRPGYGHDFGGAAPLPG